jgi:O-antigen ligase
LGLAAAAAIALFVPGAASIRESHGIFRLGTVGTADDPFAGIDRFGGELLVAIVLPWTALRGWREPTTLMTRLLTPLVAYAVVQTVSRSAALAFLATVLVWSALYPRYSRAVKLAVALVIVIAAATYAPTGLRTRFEAAAHRDQEAISRISIWRGGIRMFQDYPVFGVGVGNFAGELASHLNGAPLSNTRQDAHSIFVAALAEMGAVGFGLLLILVGRLLFEGLVVGIGRGGRDIGDGRDGEAGLDRSSVLVGISIAFVSLLIVASTVDMSRDRVLFALAALLHASFREATKPLEDPVRSREFLPDLASLP